MTMLDKAPLDAGGSAPLLACFRSVETRSIITAAFERPGLGAPRLIEGGLDAALAAIRRDKPALIVFDLASSNDPVGEMATLVSQAGRGTPLLAVGPTIELGLFRALLAAGVTDYLDRANGAAPLADAIARARRKRRRTTGSGEINSGRIVAVTGARGGVGTTSCALALAGLFAADRTTVLVDLDLAFGTAALELDLDPGTGLRDGLVSPGRIDAQFVQASLVRVNDRLSVLAAEDPCDDGFVPDAAAVAILLDELKTGFDFVVVDLPRAVTPAVTAVLAAANDVVVVTSPTLGGLRDAMRWRTYIGGVTRAATHVIQNFVVTGEGLPRGAFEKTLQVTLAAMLPYDRRSVRVAADVGQPISLAVPGGPYTLALRPLAVTLGATGSVKAQRRWSLASFPRLLARSGDVPAQA